MNRLRLLSLLSLAAVLLTALSGCPPAKPKAWVTQVVSGVMVDPVSAISGSSPTDIYALGGNIGMPYAVHFAGTIWENADFGTGNGLQALSIRSDGTGFAIENPSTVWRLLILNGQPVWAPLSSLPNAPAQLQYGMWSNMSSRLYSVGFPPAQNNTPLKNRIYIFDTSWTQAIFDSTGDLQSVSGTSDSNVIGVGSGGLIVHYDGIKATIQDSAGAGNLNGVWAISPTLAYAVGQSGVVRSYDGQAWNKENVGAGFTDLYAVWAANANDVFIVGEGGYIVHFDGRRWTEQPSGKTNRLISVWGTSGDNVYAGDRNGGILHYGPIS